MNVSNDYIGFLEQFFPPGFFIRYMEELDQVYPAAYADCYDRHEEPEAWDLIGDERRARAEQALRAVAREFQHRGVMAHSILNSTRGNYHTEVSCGPAVLTASFVLHQGDLVRMAMFRRTLARSSQLSLLGEPEEDPQGKFFGIVLHGNKRIGEKRLHEKLGFVEMAIPDRNCNGYLDVVDLANRYANADVDPADVAAAMRNGVAIETVRRPSALLREHRHVVGGQA
ncbi:MAG: hypothetical protein ACYDDQ_05830 [Vulcanimicrobiaceae bacterium]